jgi:hypothetical protein
VILLLRLAAALALLVATWHGSPLALVALLAWQQYQIERLRRELFYRQEEEALARLREYWQQLSGVKKG